MSIITAAYHCPTELVFVDADDLLNVVHFSAASKSNPSRVNTVALDVVTGETHCDCRAAECGKECWHQTLVMAAWEGSADVAYVARLNDEQLLTAGRKARAMCRSYRARCGRCLSDDQVLLLACTTVYYARQALRAARAA
jgi:hypothetical protein